jgi:2,4-dienoyl-CoA reductase-like NADH-dependent reductase (Old Yellow Enzyme family)
MDTQETTIFQSFTFKNGITLRNRVAMAPKTTWASNNDYTISDDEVRHYQSRASRVGLVITGCSRVAPNGIGFTHEFAAYDDSFLPSLSKLARAARSGGAPAILQLYHAGNKAIPELIPGGEVVSASAIEVGPMPFVSSQVIPRALTHEEILALIEAFGQATRRAIEAGFDGVELHGAHGFLLQNFFSPLYNQRTDQWGGSARNRMRFPLAVIGEVQRVVREHAQKPFLVGYRISPEEPQPESYKLPDIYPLIDALIDLNVDYLHASLTNVLDARPIGSPNEKTIAELIVDHVADRVPVVAAGHIRQPDDAARALGLGLALVAVGQSLIINPNWVTLAAQGETVDEALSVAKVPELAIPERLWTIIDTAKGWFQLTD